MSKVITIKNNHVASCGNPPNLDSSKADYVGFYENNYGEQFVLLYDRRTKTGKLYSGEFGWDNPATILNGQVSDFILSGEERAWFNHCIKTATR